MFYLWQGTFIPSPLPYIFQVIGNKYEQYQKLCQDDYMDGCEWVFLLFHIFRQALDALGLKRYCCRRMVLTHVDLIEKLLAYNSMHVFISYLNRLQPPSGIQVECYLVFVLLKRQLEQLALHFLSDFFVPFITPKTQLSSRSSKGNDWKACYERIVMKPDDWKDCYET